MLTPVSRTFQGRDVFAPAAAHIANGVDPSELGPSIDVGELVATRDPEAWVHDDHLHAEVLQVDRFGNLQLNLGRAQLEELRLDRQRVTSRSGSKGIGLQVPLGVTFADVERRRVRLDRGLVPLSVAGDQQG